MESNGIPLGFTMSGVRLLYNNRTPDIVKHNGIPLRSIVKNIVA